MTWDLKDSLLYELRHLGLNTFTFVGLTKLHRFMADFIQWFPKQDIHYLVLIFITVYSINTDKRAFNDRPSYTTQALRLAINLVLILTSNYVMGAVCTYTISKGGDQDEAMTMKCTGGIAGEIVVGYIYRLLILSFLRSVMIGIQIFNNAYYRLDLL